MGEPTVITVSECDKYRFEARCAELYAAGYTMKTCACGFVQSESYAFADSWMAVFVLKTVDQCNGAGGLL